MQVRCSGCGLILEAPDASPDSSLQASFACREYSGELMMFAMTYDLNFLQQHIVDAYTAQHAGVDTKPITTAFALIGLYLALELGYSGRQVQSAHTTLARQSKVWPVFPRPVGYAAMTIDDAIRTKEPDRNKAVMAWCSSIWEWWGPSQAAVRDLTAFYRLD